MKYNISYDIICVFESKVKKLAKIFKSKMIFIIVYLAYASIYIARVNLSIASPELINLKVLDTVQIGALGSVFSTIFASGRLINGAISDKTPPWKMLTIGLVFVAISNFLVGFFPPFLAIFLLWTVNAYAQSMLWSSVLCVISSLYEKNIAKKKSSLMVTSVATGNIVGILLNTVLITMFGARFAFLVPGVITLILSGFVLFSTHDIKPQFKETKKHKSMFQLLKEKEMLVMLIPALFHGVMKENISLWMTVFIVDTYLVDLSTSSYYILLIPSIGLVGRMIYSAVYKICKENENNVSLIGFAICVICALLLCFGKVNILVSILALSLIYAAVSMINTSMLSIYPMHYTQSGNVASVSGIMDFATYLGAGISSVIYGVVIKSLGYSPMFISWIVISLISIVLIVKININRKKSAF